MISLDECLSPHVAMPQRNHDQVEWLTPYPVLELARPVEWTCPCRATVYELWASGGQAFIRRTVQLEGHPKVHESRVMPMREARVTWMNILTGRAR